ncbi:MAG: hypothetical protein JNK09_14470 [Prolixibacteraceae bacterium]|nr:hypothetical protein [Prolixibacteraceae bacterium]
MNGKSVDRLFDILCNLCAIAILLGAFLKLQHYPYGKELVEFGFMAYFVCSSVLISRQKKQLKSLKIGQL